jgi:hypothetical protein
VDRLTAQDLMLLWPEELGWSQDIGALAILDGTSLLDGDGRFRIERAREEIGRALQERAWELGAKLVAGAPTGRWSDGPPGRVGSPGVGGR